VILFLVCLIGVLAATIAVLRSPLFDVDTVLVAGSTTVDRAEVARASGIRRGDAMVDVDPASARAAVMELAGVASARVERDWPGRIRISITDEVPLLRFDVSGTRWVVGRGGRILERIDPDAGTPDGPASPDGPGGSLPLVTVDPDVVSDPATQLRPGRQVHRSLEGAVMVLEQMSTPLRDRLDGVTMGPDGALTLLLGDDAGRVELGRPEAVPSKLLAIDSVLAGVDLTCMDVLDVREPSRPTVSRRAGCRVNPPTVGEPTPVAPTAGAGTGTPGSTGTAGSPPGGATG